MKTHQKLTSSCLPFLFLFLVLRFAFLLPLPASAQEPPEEEHLAVECSQRCVWLDKKCGHFFEDEDNVAVNKEVCKVIFGGKKSYCASLCKLDSGLFDNCEVPSDEYRDTDDCLDDCDHHNAMCQINCLDQYKQNDQVEACALACRTTFSDDHSFCRVTCDTDINAFVTCDLGHL
ncbi:MAG TPA: hypothetical protein VJC18_11670 [bacterium]|nr:hypothetical protein [bacterium]